MLSKSIPTTPYEWWNGAKPNLENLRPWGCIGYVRNTSHKYRKLGLRANRDVFYKIFWLFKCVRNMRLIQPMVIPLGGAGGE